MLSFRLHIRADAASLGYVTSQRRPGRPELQHGIESERICGDDGGCFQCNASSSAAIRLMPSSQRTDMGTYKDHDRPPLTSTRINHPKPSTSPALISTLISIGQILHSTWPWHEYPIQAGGSLSSSTLPSSSFFAMSSTPPMPFSVLVTMARN